ncbi:MAG: hypothetical protein NZ873_00165 [Crenarchaeota archaeon]|nr:hypothetical protein [Thermoproteota archaeon]MDW8033983.1 hypothetical protein [Nitrososphaerota archaeon]
MTSITTPPEVAWIVPIVIPFVIGLLIGFIVKRTIKLIIVIALLVIVLIITGYVSITFQDIYDKAMEFLPVIIDLGSGLGNILPYSSLTFIIGLLLGLWKG